ncbi:MAG: hypothetical protein PUB05_04220 [Firmicutes bacterium]|nr:hypothetical protein [Bacillota bacterium]
MLDYKKVFDGFAQLAGLENPVEKEFTLILELSIFEVEAMCGDKCSLPENAERLCTAAAAFAYYKYSLLSAAQEDSFKAGDLTVAGPDRQKAVAAARSLRDDAVAMIYDIVGNSSFYFGQV